MEIKKILFTKRGEQFYIKDTSKDYHTKYGFIKKEDFNKSKVTTNTGKELNLIDPSFIDAYKKIKRAPQIIPLKDIGPIIALTGINKNSVVIDAGAGSGGVCCFLANIVKKVYTYDIRDDFINIVKKNKENLNLKNLVIKKHDIYKSIPKKDVDLIILDLPEPWLVIKNAEKALKEGGFLVSYSPTIPQVSDFVETVKFNHNFIYIKTIEIIERQWEFDKRKIRPKSQPFGHSGFLTFIRKI